MLFQSDQRFKIWDYNVSHKQLLLRSPRGPETAENIDIVFWGVEFIQLPTVLVGIELSKISSESLASLEAACGKKSNPESAFCIVSGKREFFLVADGWKVLGNTLDIFDSSLAYFNEDETGSSAGEILAHS